MRCYVTIRLRKKKMRIGGVANGDLHKNVGKGRNPGGKKSKKEYGRDGKKGEAVRKQGREFKGNKKSNLRRSV